MSTRAYFFGGPADGTAREFPVRPPSHFQVEALQGELDLKVGHGNVPVTRVTYRLHPLVDDVGRATYVYLAPQTTLSSVFRKSFDLYVEAVQNATSER